MPNSEIVQETPITLSELKEKINVIDKKDEELNFRANKVKEYLNKFVKLDVKKVEEIKKKIAELEIPRLKDRQVVKIIDIMPDNLDEIKMIFVGETTTVNPENLQKILDVVKNYVSKK
tara:strand:- start:180 stop:533 length:354 start_codon:yes stop_codon:yes gene_type:complete